MKKKHKKELVLHYRPVDPLWDTTLMIRDSILMVMTIGLVLPAGLSDREKLKSIGTLPTSKVYSRLKLGDKKDG
eukprot:442621-Pelagomonas_calceolata.AAC.1